jgi:hypothetical protein
MKNNDTILLPDRNGADRCNCPKCDGRAGTTRVCLNARRLAAHLQENSTARKAALLLLSALFLPGQADACVTNPGADHTPRVQHGAALVDHAGENKPAIDTDYYRSSDNPFMGD